MRTKTAFQSILLPLLPLEIPTMIGNRIRKTYVPWYQGYPKIVQDEKHPMLVPCEGAERCYQRGSDRKLPHLVFDCPASVPHDSAKIIDNFVKLSLWSRQKYRRIFFIGP